MQATSMTGSGEFLVCLPINKNYLMNVSKNGYLFASENFSLKGLTDNLKAYEMNVPLTPIKAGEKVVLKNIFFETASFTLKEESKIELQKLKSFLILNATTTALNASTPGLFVSSVRGPRSSSNVLSYDTNTNEIYYNGSSERYKYDIASLSKDTSVIYDLQPREFKYKITDEPDVGLIAEEAFKCDPSFAYLDKDKIPEGIQWNVITTYLIAELKKLKMELEELGG